MKTVATIGSKLSQTLIELWLSHCPNITGANVFVNLQGKISRNAENVLLNLAQKSKCGENSHFK